MYHSRLHHIPLPHACKYKNLPHSCVPSPWFALYWHNKQECIPVGCVPPMHWPTISHSVWGVCMACTPLTMHTPSAIHARLPRMPPPTTHTSLPCTPPPCMPPCHACPPAMHVSLPCTPPCGQTHTCKDIKLRKLRLQVVMMYCTTRGGVKHEQVICLCRPLMCTAIRWHIKMLHQYSSAFTNLMPLYSCKLTLKSTHNGKLFVISC